MSGFIFALIALWLFAVLLAQQLQTAFFCAAVRIFLAVVYSAPHRIEAF